MFAVTFAICAVASWLAVQSLKKIAVSGSASNELFILFELINGERAEQCEAGRNVYRASSDLLSFSNHYLLFVSLCFRKIHNLIYHIRQKLYPLFADALKLKTFGKEIDYEKGQKGKYAALLGACGAG